MQPLFSGMLCAEITPLPALLRSLHISPGRVCDCVRDALCVSFVCRLTSICLMMKRLFIVKNKVYKQAGCSIVFDSCSGHFVFLCVELQVGAVVSSDLGKSDPGGTARVVQHRGNTFGSESDVIQSLFFFNHKLQPALLIYISV